MASARTHDSTAVQELAGTIAWAPAIGYASFGMAWSLIIRVRGMQ